MMDPDLWGLQALHTAAVAQMNEHQHQGGYEHVPPVSVAQEMHHNGGGRPLPASCRTSGCLCASCDQDLLDLVPFMQVGHAWT